ncbi:MAG: 4-hydroxy-tetrahydrodipicolinate reductase [Halanaerobiales bacterium]|nr:4-hydroxy-tetrahydrodipicolinate reductase [Halanaerobiales bacterium]
MLKVIINGCNGTMGQVLSKEIKKDETLMIVAGVDHNLDKYDNDYPVYQDIFEINEAADVIIDFSKPDSLPGLLKYGSEKKIGLVIATTGLSPNEISYMQKTAVKMPIFYSANMSLGINLLIDLVKKAAPVLDDSFDIEIIEKHHNKKIDAPSGTAYMIADAINGELNHAKEYVFGRETKKKRRSENEIGIHAIRGGTIPGEHTVIFAGTDEIIEIKHSALSKSIFALGALKAAKFISMKDHGFYTMDDLIRKD